MLPDMSFSVEQRFKWDILGDFQTSWTRFRLFFFTTWTKFANNLKNGIFFDLLGFWRRARALSLLSHLMNKEKFWNWKKKKLFHTTFQSTTNFRFSLAKNLPGREPLLKKKKNWKVYITQWISGRCFWPLAGVLSFC